MTSLCGVFVALIAISVVRATLLTHVDDVPRMSGLATYHVASIPWRFMICEEVTSLGNTDHFL